MILVVSSPAEGVSIPEAEWFASHIEKLGVAEADVAYVVMDLLPDQLDPALRHKMDMSDPANPIIVPVKPVVLALTCDGELVEERYYKATMGTPVNFTLTLYDGAPPDLAKPIGTVYVRCNRGVLSQQEFVLDGNTSSVNFQWTGPSETIECKLRADIPGGDAKSVINRSTKVLLTNPA